MRAGVYIYIYIYIYIIYTHVYIYIYIIYIYLYMCVYIYIYIHTCEPGELRRPREGTLLSERTEVPERERLEKHVLKIKESNVCHLFETCTATCHLRPVRLLRVSI